MTTDWCLLLCQFLPGNNIRLESKENNNNNNNDDDDNDDKKYPKHQEIMR